MQGGAEKQLGILASSLDPSRFRPLVVQLAPRGAVPLKNGTLGPARVFHFPTGKFYSPSGFGQMLRIARLAREERVDIIQTFFEKAEVMGWLARRLAGVPVWMTSRRDLGFKRKPVYDRIFRISSRSCDGLVAVCRAAKDETVTREGFPAGKIEVIYNALEDGTLGGAVSPSGSRADLGLPTEGPLVGMVANFNFEIKGHRYFIEAAARVARERSGVLFVLVGDGALRAACERQARDLGIAERIHFLGKRGDVPAILAHLDVSVLCSTSEGLSNVIMESMAACKPVVATRVGGNPELVQDGVTGLVVPPADSTALGEAIGALLDDPPRAAAMGAAARQIAEERFSVRAMVEAHEKLYARLCLEKI
ncbi:glycosyl transferase [Geobacter hydrogenophilus]|uniref:Glycosyl transferase n=2 Tax=Geobacter hydrogenophilus TaxID=40983 RepID=A0A9W6G2J0_9BACT|nr:glycosyl transferase [Geobacter hydrogenophilus]